MDAALAELPSPEAVLDSLRKLPTRPLESTIRLATPASFIERRPSLEGKCKSVDICQARAL